MLQALAILAAAVAVHAAPAVQWRSVGRADGEEVVEFSAALFQKNLDVLENVLLDVSDPESVNYGLYPDAADLNEMTRPDAAHFEEVRSWLESEPSTACRVMPSSLRCRSTVAALERTLGTQFSTFQHPETGDLIHRVPRDTAYTVPESLKGKLSFLSGLSGFPIEHYGVARPLKASDTDPTVIPATLVNMYSLSSAKGSSQVTVAAAEFQNYPAYGDSDLTTFIKEAAVTPFTIAKKIGPFNGNDPQAESSLDVQYIGATGVGCTNWYVTEAQWMYDFSENIVANPTTYPSIMSMSYGWSEADQCQISPSSPPCSDGSAAFVQAVNANFLKYSTSGHTLFASSGDSGAHGRTDPTCQDPKVRPAFPAASPYVTAVGATQFDTSNVKTGGSAPVCSTLGPCAESGTEIVASPKTGALIASGGGFSNVAPMPAWAHAAQTAYQGISGACPPNGDYNSSGRGFPDVAALGHNYYIQLQGQEYHVDGTSCSSPVWAGVLSLINSYEISKGRSAVGFLNPTLYKLPASAFNDVTSGNNYCTENTCSCTTGFTAEKGWDATTGFGTPNYEGITAALDEFAARREAIKFGRGQ